MAITKNSSKIVSCQNRPDILSSQKARTMDGPTATTGASSTEKNGVKHAPAVSSVSQTITLNSLRVMIFCVGKYLNTFTMPISVRKVMSGK